MLYIFADILSTANACFQLSEHLRFFGCEKDSTCFKDALPSLVEVPEKRILSVDFNVARNEEAVEVFKVFLIDMRSLDSRRRVNSWTVLPRLVSEQIIPVRKT